MATAVASKLSSLLPTRYRLLDRTRESMILDGMRTLALIPWLVASGCSPPLSEPPKTAPPPAIPPPVADEPGGCEPPWKTLDSSAYGMPAMLPPARLPTPPPSEWSAASRRQLELVSAICAPSYRDTFADGRVELGCQRCDRTGSDAAPLRTHDLLRPVLHSIEGSFTADDSDEAIVVAAGCGPTDFSDGDVSLLERRGGRFRLSRRIESLFGCLPWELRKGDRGLVCAQMNLGIRNVLRVVDFRFESPVSTLFDFAAADALSICNLPEAGSSTTLVETQFEARDVDGDGVLDITTDLVLAELAPEARAAVLAQSDLPDRCRCSRALSPPGTIIRPGCRCPSLELPPRTGRAFHLEFHWTPRGYEPVAPTRAAISEIHAAGL